MYLEKLVRRARHVEVQVLGDTYGNLVHLYERDCSVQRRNQKVVERAPAPYLSDERRAGLCESALTLARAANYTHAGTVEFLMDADTGQFYFIEVNPRIQVEHTVTELVTGIDIVKAQIRISEGARIGAPDPDGKADPFSPREKGRDEGRFGTVANFPSPSIPLPEGEGSKTHPLPEEEGGKTHPPSEGEGSKTHPLPAGEGSKTHPLPAGEGSKTHPLPDGEGSKTHPLPEGEGGNTHPLSEGEGSKTHPLSAGEGGNTRPFPERQGRNAGSIASVEIAAPAQRDIRLNGHALQCRITTEDPEKAFTPDYGRITAYRSAAGFGIRLDGGTAYSGAVITPFYDSLLVKVTAWGQSPDESIARMDRALREFRVRGVSTNLQFLENVIAHPLFRSGECTTRFIDDTPELLRFSLRRDRATKLLQFLGEVVVNGNPEMKGRKRPEQPVAAPLLPDCDLAAPPPPGSRQRLLELGPRQFARWMRAAPRALFTDTTMRDAHQSLFATRMRSCDMLAIAPHYARLAPELLSLECWGGATFDVAMRFLKEDPWERLAALRQRVPNILLQMLLRSSNAVGYTNYADNVVRHFVQQAAAGGIDLFRVFDSLNWVDNMRVAMDAVIETGMLCEAAICYSGDLFDAARPKYNLKYYVAIAKQLEQAGAHILGIKDMAGVCRPRAARELVRVLREETGLPVHFHTHDTSGIAAASVLAAIEAGVDAVDGALDAMSGLTSQPNLGAIAAALAGSEHDPGLNLDHLQALSRYWEGVRRHYAPFESDMRAGTCSVYRHEMPGGQYTNLREQARALGLESRWAKVEETYAEVNLLFGDIIKVTPTSKVVGDMALYMVSHDLSAAEVTDPEREIAFPESVVGLFRGEVGFPPGGFPPELSKKILKGTKPLEGRAGALLPPVDFEAKRAEMAVMLGRRPSEMELSSYLMYPKVFRDFAEHRAAFEDVSVIPTPVFFNGLRDGEEVAVEIDLGKTLIVRLQGRAEPDEDGECKLFFELNGQARLIRVAKAGLAATARHPKIDEGNPGHIGAPMPGAIVTVAVAPGQKVVRGDLLLCLEAMKMETMLRAERDGTVKQVHVKPGSAVTAKDLLIELE